ncbi:hypothetical protein HXZ60_10440 [Acinetobacter towneri]|uniref:hypothetical protein n=1 Tax=Acinetobacter towneri TaxID=202956 RepID=UPI0025784258|nr:hypothetical protein [Acinetobacter towneri]MDM1283975.1 hypothetical protein [Acinetobacter towneri]
MKKLLLSLALSSSALFAAPMATANPQFSTLQMAQVQLDNLSFKNIMRQFYSGQMSRGYVDDEELSKMPHITLGHADEDQYSTVALMHPLVEYKNNANETRYLIMIEKIKVSNEGGVVSCHACTGEADLFSFKKTKSGQYQLVSRSAKNAEFSGSWGRVGLDLEEIAKNLKPLGKNLVGSIFQNGYTSTGTTELWWEALHLPENDYINSYGVADAGADNGGSYEEDSPLYYSYDSRLDVINNGAAYFPLKVTYQGEKPTEDYEQIRKVNYSKLFHFNAIKKEYK